MFTAGADLLWLWRGAHITVVDRESGTKLHTLSLSKCVVVSAIDIVEGRALVLTSPRP